MSYFEFASRLGASKAALSSEQDTTELTVAHVLPASTPAEHDQRVRAWSRSAWQVWAEHHPQARTWPRRALGE